MITQQVASYLIKKMETAIKKPHGGAEDKTDELFKYYLANKNKKTPADVIVDGNIDNAAIVEAFRWRAAELVCNPEYNQTSRTNISPGLSCV